MLEKIKERKLSEQLGTILHSLTVWDIITPELAALVAIASFAYAGDRILGVWTFIHGYIGLLKGITGPMTPYTDAMSLITLIAVPAVLIRRRVNIISAFAIAIGIVVAAMTSFEFWWDMFFLAGHPITSWFGFPGPFWYYAFAFNSLAALWFVGIRYWRFSWPALVLILLYPVMFIAWYLSGYAQPWQSFAIDSAYVWNAVVKIFAFLGLMAPVLGFGLHREHGVGTGKET